MIKEYLEDILNNYLIEKDKKFSDNWIAGVLRSNIPRDLKTVASLGNEYLVQGSAGQGNWAEIPWICIFDRTITTTAQEGYYVVYLFDAYMEGVYLSLNQGWTQYQDEFSIDEARKNIKRNAEALQHLLRTALGDFSFSPINLHARNVLGKGYELGHICGKYYLRKEIPDDITLANDLRNLLSVYREAKGIIGNNIIDLSFAYDDESEDKDENEEHITKERIVINKSVSKAKTSEEIEKILSKIEEEYKDKEPQTKRQIAKAIVRNSRIARLIKGKAKYLCAICGILGFEKRNGERYAEVHHKEELAKTGLDLPSNIICVCPLCHRIIHYGSDNEIDKLREKGAPILS